MNNGWLKILPFAFCVSVMLLMTVACSDEDIDRRYTDYRTDVVTYLGNDGSGARFDMPRRDDSPSILLLSDIALSSNVKQGQRVLLRYDWADNTDSVARRIHAYGVAAIVSDSLRYTVNPLIDYLNQMESIKLMSIWRTGGYLNLRCQAEYTGKTRYFYLLLDSATVRNDTIHCYLINNTHGDTTYHWREAYASFYVGNAWNRSTCRTMRVHLNNAANPAQTTYDFNKQ